MGDPDVAHLLDQILSKVQDLDGNTGQLEDKLNGVISELQDVELDVEDVNLNTDELEQKLDSAISELQGIDTNTDELESELQSVNTELDSIQSNTADLESELQSVNTELDELDSNTTNLESLLNDIVSELQDVETDVESVNSLLDELEDALASVGQDQIRVDILDEGDVATEATLSSVNDFLDAIEDALESTGTDELRVNTEPSEPIAIQDFDQFEVDPDNSTETLLNAGEEFVGQFKSWDQNVGIAIALVSDVPGGPSGNGTDALQIELSGNGTDVGRTINIDYPPGNSTGEGIQPIIAREAEFYRVRYQNGDQAQSTFRLNTIELPKALQDQLRPIGDSVTDRTVANTVKSVISAQDPDGNYVTIDADRFDNLKTQVDSVGKDAYRYAVRGDATLYGTQVVGSKVPQIDLQWHEIEVADDVLNTEAGNNGTYSQLSGSGVFNSGTGPDDQYIGESFDIIDYVSGYEIQFIFTGAYTQPPTSTGDFLTLGLSDGDEGFEIGYKGTEFGIRHLARGSEQEFVKQADFNLDKLDGNPESEYTRNEIPVPIDTTTENVWRIRFGWYGTAPTHIEVQAPDGHWVAAHKFDFTQDSLPQTETPNLPGRINIDKNSSDSTNLEFRSGAWYGGIVANVSVAQQPDGDFVSEKASGAAFTTTELLTANETFTSGWYDTDGWESFEVQVLSDQPSADGGVEIEFTDDVQSENPQEEANTVFTYTQEQADENEALLAILPTQLDGLRVKYTNSNIGQNEFTLSITLRTSRIPESTSLTNPINSTDLASVSKSIIYSTDENGDTEVIGRDDEALKVSIDNQNVDLDVSAFDDWNSTQAEVSNLSPARLDPSPLADRKTISVANEGPNDAEIYIGNSSAVTENSGYPIALEEEEELAISEAAEVWAILSSDVSGNTQIKTLSANNTVSSSGVVSPGNAFVSDDSDASYGEQGDEAEYDMEDFSFSSGFSDIAGVRLGFEGQRGGAGTQTIAYQEQTNAIQAGGTSITTSGQLTADDTSFYVAVISARPNDAEVGSISGLGLTWTRAARANDPGGGPPITEIWTAEGEPTVSEDVTANFNATVDVSAINAARLTGVDLDNPISATDTSTAFTQNYTLSPTPNGSGDFVVTGAALASESTHTAGVPDVEQVELSQGGPNSERMTYATSTREITSANESVDGSWGTSAGWAASAVALNNADLVNPEVFIEYEVGAEGVGPTSLTEVLDNDADLDFTQDITGDRTWTVSDLDSISLFVSQERLQARDAEIDHLFVEVDEAETGATQRVGILEEGN